MNSRDLMLYSYIKGQGGGEEFKGLVTAFPSYDNYATSGDGYSNVSMYTRSGDIVVFVINHRGDLTLPQDVTLIHTSVDATASSQQLTFAKYEASVDDFHNWTFRQSITTRIFVDTVVFRGVTITYTGKFYKAITTTPEHSIQPVNKNKKQSLLWGFSHPTMVQANGRGLQTTPSDLLRIQWPDAIGTDTNIIPRSATFYDNGAGAVNRTFEAQNADSNSTMIIDALEIS